jgi:hypothetical protein
MPPNFVPTLVCSTALLAGLVCLAQAASDARAARLEVRALPARFIRTGHDNIVVNPALRRLTGVVTAVGAPDARGHVVSFELAPLGPGMTAPEPKAMIGWRLTILAGKRFGSAYEVARNTASEVTVKEGELDGIAVKDVFVIEEPDAVVAPVADPAAAAPSAS